MVQTARVTGVATKVYTEDGYTKVRYHRTVVVMFDDKETILNTNGWASNTTKLRMNQASNQFGLGYYVFQKDYEWFIQTKSGTIPFLDYTRIPREEVLGVA
jgi:hypothetical protein